MNIPGYDAWRLQGPPEGDTQEAETCPGCGGDCWVWESGTMNGELSRRKVECPDCGGSGEVPVAREEPDADYLRDLRDDR